MDVRRCGLVILACLAACGCRRDPYMDAYLDTLSAEKRVLEDRLYEMEYEYKQKVQELAACQAHSDGDQASPRKAKAKPEKKVREPAGKDSDAIPKVEIDLPPGLEPPATEKTSRTTASKLTLASYTEPVDGVAADDLSDSPPRPPKQLWEETVASIYLNTQITRGEDFDGNPGDDGLTVLLEPRNAAGRFVPQAGKVSLVLLDPAESGDAARVARWNFAPEVAARVLRAQPPNRGLLFRVPWPEQSPEHSRLQLFVRYETADGHRLETHREITVRLPDKVAETWTPRPSAETVKPAAAIAADTTANDPSVKPAPTTIRAVHEAAVTTPAIGPSSSQPVGTGTQGRLWKPYR